jgi:hypothetical protein
VIGENTKTENSAKGNIPIAIYFFRLPKEEVSLSLLLATKKLVSASGKKLLNTIAPSIVNKPKMLA